MTTANKRMQQRRGTSEVWAAKDPVLLSGELGYDTTTGGVKIGDGVKKWSELGEIKGSGGIAFPASDGNLYAVKNGKWVTIKADGTYQTGVIPPAIEEINKQGELSVSFFIPYKFALSETDTTLADIAHREWRFPFAEGRIKRVTFKCMSQTGTAAQFDLRVNGMTALVSPVGLTTDWQERTINTYIKKDDKVEFYVTQNIEATDLHVDLLIQVGNAQLVFVGEPDMEPNVYCVGSKKGTWGANGSDAPDGFFKRLYVPGAVKVKGLATQGIVFKDASGGWHVVNDNLHMSSIVPNTPTPLSFPEGYEVLDITNATHTSSSQYTLHLLHCADGNLYNIGSTRLTLLEEDVSLIPDTDMYHNAQIFTYIMGNGDIKYRKYNTQVGVTSTIPAANIPYGEIVKETLGVLVLTSAKKLYTINNTELAEATFVGALQGTIEHIWGYRCSENMSSMQLLFSTTDGALWGVGNGANIGHGTSGRVNEPQKIFESIDVKDIVMASTSTLLLTQEGKVYICGGVGSALVPSGHELYNKTIYTFHPIWENYRFSDIAMADNTFVGIGEYLGEIANS